jgi:hypothetical protein
MAEDVCCSPAARINGKGQLSSLSLSCPKEPGEWNHKGNRIKVLFRQTGKRDETVFSRIVCCIVTKIYLRGTAYKDHVNSGCQRSGYQWHQQPSGVNHMQNNKNN